MKKLIPISLIILSFNAHAWVATGSVGDNGRPLTISGITANKTNGVPKVPRYYRFACFPNGAFIGGFWRTLVPDRMEVQVRSNTQPAFIRASIRRIETSGAVGPTYELYDYSNDGGQYSQRLDLPTSNNGAVVYEMEVRPQYWPIATKFDIKVGCFSSAYNIYGLTNAAW
jgi:hypothetical protein